MTDHQFYFDPEDPETPNGQGDPEDPQEPEEPNNGNGENPEEPGGGEEAGEVSMLKDVSGLFNERGFLKSNTINFSEDEIINDFSGNLIYTQKFR